MQWVYDQTGTGLILIHMQSIRMRIRPVLVAYQTGRLGTPHGVVALHISDRLSFAQRHNEEGYETAGPKHAFSP